ncbi:6191_t:CDS:1, partial [Scutellospora calospora]
MAAFSCLLCSEIYDTKKKLQNHERNKHKNNKFIPHRHILQQPSNETLSFYQDTIIIHLKKSLGFNRRLIGKKYITIDAFPESVFLFLFENEDRFKYIPSQRKYYCTLEGATGSEKLKSIFKYNQIIFRENASTSTRGYILFEDNDSQYKVVFCWKQKEWKENNRLFLTRTLSINFTTDSSEFVD